MKGPAIALQSLTMVLVASQALAEVKLVTRPDGTRYMYNTGRKTSFTTPPPRPAQTADVDLDAVIGRYSREVRLDPDLVKAVIRAESSFDERAVSHQGAMGLMQLMPDTADALAVSDPFDPEQNVRGGTRYLRQMLDAFRGSLELALAAYNAGPEAVHRFGGVPPYRETVDYVERVMRLYRSDPTYAVRASRHLGRGRQTYLSRGADGKLTMSTTPPRVR
jgi:soluble lytic murein transglycosylase